MTLCVGCGDQYEAPDCPTCDTALAEALREYKHWPLETSLSAGALYHVEIAIREYLNRHRVPEPSRMELANTANTLASYFQQLVDSRKATNALPTDEDLLS
jgi:hypothetical protein